VSAFAPGPAATGTHLTAGRRRAWNTAAMSQARFMSTKEKAEATATSADADDTDDDAADAEGPAPTILPEFAAARDSVTETLNAAVETKSMAAMLAHFTNEYFAAASNSFAAGNAEYNPKDAAQRFMKALELGMKHGMGGNKFTFGVTHKALRGKGDAHDNELEDADGNPNTYDFYKFGCDFFRPAMDLENSAVLGQENLAKAVQQIKDGENVVFLANHQSEADPQVFSVLLETIGLNDEAADVVYVAGHKVTTDALAIPFSMGRNLLCIHSKKHLDADPETKPVKQRQNLAAMSEMLGMLKEGGASLWVAPSGGRDRRDVETGEVPIAKFDRKTIDMFRLMGVKSKKKTHFYPLAMVSYDLCPPPDFVEAGVGEERNVRFCPIGINCGEEVPNVGGAEGREKFTQHAFEDADRLYHETLKAIEENLGKK